MNASLWQGGVSASGRPCLQVWHVDHEVIASPLTPRRKVPSKEQARNPPGSVTASAGATWAELGQPLSKVVVGAEVNGGAKGNAKAEEALPLALLIG